MSQKVKVEKTYPVPDSSRTNASYAISFSYRQSPSLFKSPMPSILSTTVQNVDGFNSPIPKEDLASPVDYTPTPTKSPNKIENQDSFSIAYDAFRHSKTPSLASINAGDLSTKAGTMTSLPRFRVRQILTPQSLGMLPSEVASMPSISQLQAFWSHKGTIKSLNDVEIRQEQSGGVNKDSEALTDRETPQVDLAKSRSLAFTPLVELDETKLEFLNTDVEEEVKMRSMAFKKENEVRESLMKEGSLLGLIEETSEKKTVRSEEKAVNKRVRTEGQGSGTKMRKVERQQQQSDKEKIRCPCVKGRETMERCEKKENAVKTKGEKKISIVVLKKAKDSKILKKEKSGVFKKVQDIRKLHIQIKSVSEGKKKQEEVMDYIEEKKEGEKEALNYGHNLPEISNIGKIIMPSTFTEENMSLNLSNSRLLGTQASEVHKRERSASTGKIGGRIYEKIIPRSDTGTFNEEKEEEEPKERSIVIKKLLRRTGSKIDRASLIIAKMFSEQRRPVNYNKTEISGVLGQITSSDNQCNVKEEVEIEQDTVEKAKEKEENIQNKKEKQETKVLEIIESRRADWQRMRRKEKSEGNIYLHKGRVLEEINNRTQWEAIEEEGEEEVKPLVPKEQQVFVQGPNSFFEWNMDNKFVKEYGSMNNGVKANIDNQDLGNYSSLPMNHEELGGTKTGNLYKGRRSNTSTIMVRYYDELEPVMIQPKFMQVQGSMCFTELWGRKNKKEFYKNMRKAFQADTRLSMDPNYGGIYRAEKRLDSEGLKRRREANAAVYADDLGTNIKLSTSSLTKPKIYSPKGAAKHTRAFVLQPAEAKRPGTSMGGSFSKKSFL